MRCGSRRITRAALLVCFTTPIAACGDVAEAPGGSAATDGSAGTGGGAGDPGTGGEPDLPWPQAPFPALPAEAKDVPAARIELGRMLFFDPVLSADRETACTTCHSELWGMGDALPVAVGHGAGLLSGPGREGENTLRRNSLSLFNLAFRETLLWDGGSSSLEEQALLPMLADDELSRDPEEVVAELATIDEYRALFAEAFPDSPRVTVDGLAQALAAYQRTFISNRSVYDAYVDGFVTAMSDAQVEGMFRFAEFGCETCHAPPLFESETFADRGVLEREGVIDGGLEETTGDPDDRRKFRTPTLRNITTTGPYFHNGTASKVEDAVRHELDQTGLPFTEEDLELIVEFIDKTLRDDSNDTERPDTVPSGLQVPLDGVVFPGR